MSKLRERWMGRSVLIAVLAAATVGSVGTGTAAAESTYFEEVTKLVPPGLQSGDWFGSVSLDGDVALIGAVWDNDDASSAGAVYFYRRDTNGDWQYVNRFNAQPPRGGAGFGCDSAPQGDFALVGAWYDNLSGHSNAGAVYAFERAGDQWIRTSEFFPSDSARGDNFGVGVATQDDVALVGAMLDDDHEPDSGSVYVYRRDPSGEWLPAGKFHAPVPGAGDCFGSDVYISGDLAVVAAWQEDVGTHTDAGAAYVYRRNGASWDFVFKLLATDGMPGDCFGEAVAMQGNGDVILVGAHRVDDGLLDDVGAVYAFRRTGPDAWQQVTRLLADDRAAWDSFGVRLAMQDDTVLVGAFGDDGTGSAYVYRLVDRDLDGLPNDADNCWRVYNPGQDDGDGDGVGDACEIPGDTDCDGTVDFGDINPFVLALIDPDAYRNAYPDCDRMNADCDGDLNADFGDINAFVAMLLR